MTNNYDNTLFLLPISSFEIHEEIIIQNLNIIMILQK